MKHLQGKPTLEDRAENAQLALETYEGLKEGAPSDEPLAARVSDLLADLLHLAASKGEQLELEALARRAQEHFAAEVAEENQA